MARQLAAARADVLALQEVDPARWQDFLDAMAPHGYAGVLQSRKKDSLLSFSLAFLYNTQRVRLLW